MRALDPEVVDAVWAAVEPLLPVRVDRHPLGCHRARVPDRVCFEGMLIRLVIGCAWVDVERLMGNVVSDTTLRHRRDEWIRAGVFDRLADEAVAGYDRVIGLDLSECSVDGSQHKAPLGGEGTGPSPVDRGKRGWKWSLFADRHGIPLGWFAAGANRNDCVLLAPTLADRRATVVCSPTARRCTSIAATTTALFAAGRRRRHRRPRLLQSPSTRNRDHQEDRAARVALADRTHQQLALELRSDTPQHRPVHPCIASPSSPRHHAAAHRQTHRLAQPMGPVNAPIRSTS